MTNVKVAVKRLAHGAKLPLPSYATSFSSGADLFAALDIPMHISPGAHAIIPTGIAIQLPAGFEAQIRPRSGLAANHGITVLNSPGTIDADYRGEIKVIMVNHGIEPFPVEYGMRIAQIIIAPVSIVIWQETTELDETLRGAGGFGSTGIKNTV